MILAEYICYIMLGLLSRDNHYTVAHCVLMLPLPDLAPFHSYLVMPYMFTDLSKVRGHLSEDKVQFLVYQMLCGLRVSWRVLLNKAIL